MLVQGGTGNNDIADFSALSSNSRLVIDLDAGNNVDVHINFIGFADTLLYRVSLQDIEGITATSNTDSIIASDSINILDGGLGEDTISYEKSTDGVTLNLAEAGVVATGLDGHADGDQISNFENIIGSSQADTLTGNSGANTIEAGEGNDIIAGENKDTAATGQQDTLEGGMGLDTYVYYYTDAIKHGHDVINEEIDGQTNNIQIILEDPITPAFDWTNVITSFTADADRVLLEFNTDNHISLLRDQVNDDAFKLTFLHKNDLLGNSAEVSAAELIAEINTNLGYVSQILTGGGNRR